MIIELEHDRIASTHIDTPLQRIIAAKPNGKPFSLFSAAGPKYDRFD